MLRNTKRCSVFEPLATVPKLWLVVENIFVAHSCAKAASDGASTTMSAPAASSVLRKVTDPVENMRAIPGVTRAAMRKPEANG